VCALLSNDEETCVTIARFFMRDYQFTTDSYRMFAAITRACQSPISWYSSGPTQKYMLRQIKAMDYALVDEASRAKYFSEKGSYSAVDENGRTVVNKDMDIALLMLYGHILYIGTSYSYALSMRTRLLKK
jgi:general transcription factor 3C polypeptide 3 (transcription factor C subunit 4)